LKAKAKDLIFKAKAKDFLTFNAKANNLPVEYFIHIFNVTHFKKYP